MITQLAFLLQAAAETTGAAPEVAAGVAKAAAPVVTNPYGLGSLWLQGDFVAKFTLIILACMSMATWYVMLTKLWDQHRVMRHAKAIGGSFWKAASLKDAAAKLPLVNTYRGIVDDGLAAADQTKGFLTDKIEQHEWISINVRRSVELITGRLKEGMAILATVGSTAPFVGLFGTVWGIYHALIAIGIAGQASIDKVAGPVGEALIMTAIGLAVAVPAVLGYNWLMARNKVALEDVRNFAADVEAYLLTSVDNKAGK
jgi:biopolymer transport protein ExbB